MKKLMIAAAIVCATAMSQAAEYNWGWTANESGRLFDGTGSSTANRYEGMGYLINGDTLGQEALLAAFYAETVDSSYLQGNSLSYAAFENGRSEGDTFKMGAAQEFNAYFVALSDDGKGLYISDSPTFSLSDVGTSLAEFGSQSDYSATFKDAGAAYAGAGWYQTVPEPTSGLLLLLGVAGLALRRRRA